jgi:hypothetical protein
MKRTLLSVLFAACALSACITRTEATLTEDAKRTNALSVGMTKAQVLGVMGSPVATTAKGQYECLEYRLIEHTDNFTIRRLSAYSVYLKQGMVLQYESSWCGASKIDDWIKEDKSASRGDADSLSRQIGAKDLKTPVNQWNNLSTGMSKADFVTVVPDEPLYVVKDERYGLECEDHSVRLPDGSSRSRFAAFKNGRLIASGNSNCALEARKENFAPGGKYQYLLTK